MRQTIEAKEYELRRIFCDDYRFEIPDYQRPYVWTTEQTSELLDDLLTAMGDDVEIQEAPPYFLGSIVLIKDSGDTLAQVVDGQQRLTTLTILFCVLRELSSDESATSSLDKFVWERGDKFSGSKDRLRLTPRKRDRDFFEKNLQKRGGVPKFAKRGRLNLSSTEQRIYENTEHLWTVLSNIDQSQRDRLSEFLVRRCYLVVVSASDQSSAYRIFHVMNDRGLDLSPTDILKAEIIGKMPDKDRPNYTSEWENIEENLGREEFRNLFAHIRMIHAKSKAHGDLVKEFREHVFGEVSKCEFIDNDLLPLAEAYRIISRIEFESDREIQKANIYLRHLRHLKNSDWIPPAMEYLRMHGEYKNAFFKFIRDLERLAYFLLVTRSNVNVRISRYARVLRAIESGEDLYADTSALQLTSSEKLSTLNALDGEIYSQPEVPRIILLRLDGLLADGIAKYEYNYLSIEHVLPQNPGPDSKWMSWFPEEEIRKSWTHKLANLVLLSQRKNAKAQNYDFERKKREYFQREGVTTFALTSQILEHSEWTPDILKKRQSHLIERLKSEWRLG